MIIELTESYIPEKILFRDKQIEKIEKTFRIFKEFGTAASILCQGYTGSGKTSVLRKVLNQDGNDSFIFAIGSTSHTCHQLLKSIFDMNYSTLGKLLTEGINKLKKNPKILIFDEINKLKDKAEIRLLFDCLNTINRETDCPFIMLTNVFGLNQMMADDAKKTLNFEIVEFPSYQFEELKGIFLERARVLKEKHGIKILDVDVSTACMVAYKDGEGSARQVRIILQRCLMENNWSSEHILRVIEGILEENVANRIKNMPPKEIEFLKIIYKIYSKKKQNSVLPLVVSYEDIQKETGLSKPRISTNVDTFENDYGLVETIYHNRGRRGGNRRDIIFKEGYLNKIEEVLGQTILNIDERRTK